MRRFAVFMLFAPLVTGSGFAQSSNTNAGLLGAAAGASLGAAANQAATTPSSVAGGGGGSGSSPMEIQIMAFDGLRKVAEDIAGITSDHAVGCGVALKLDRGYQRFDGDRTTLINDNKELEKARKNLREHRNQSDQDIEDIKKGIAELELKFNNHMTDLDKAINALSADTKNNCAILVEDMTSANQVALYQAVEGYYGHLNSIHSDLQGYFSLQAVSPPSIPLLNNALPSTQSVRVTNVGSRPREIKDITVQPQDKFGVDGATCKKQLAPSENCDIVVTFWTTPAAPPVGTYTGALNILNGEPGSVSHDSKLTVQLTRVVQAPPETEAQKRQKAKLELDSLISPKDRQKNRDLYDALLPGARIRQSEIDKLGQYITSENRSQNKDLIEVFGGPAALATTAAPAEAPATTPTAAAGGGATTPVDMTYLSGIMTALGGLKNGITYTPSSFQPTTQAFETLIQSELKLRAIFPYTSTSALNLSDATGSLTSQFGDMLAWGNDVAGWANLCKPPTGSGQPSGNTQSSSASNSACTKPDVVVNVAVAQQMIAGYTALLTAASDGSGNPTIADILRGKVLSDKMAKGIPSLQVAVAAAGGNTRTNSFFLLNLFYTPKPSFNAGVIATFELRDKDNLLLQSGARSVLFDYKKWKPHSFHPSDIKHNGACTSFCGEN